MCGGVGGVHAQTHTPIFLERLSVLFSKDSKNNLRPPKHLSSHSKGKKWIWEQEHMPSGTGNPEATEEDAGPPQLSHCTTSHFQSGKLQALAVSGRNVGKLHPSFRHTLPVKYLRPSFSYQFPSGSRFGSQVTPQGATD